MLRRPLESAQYTSPDYAKLARENGVVLSVGRKGECWDNAVAESFFATIKRELIDTRAWPTRQGLHRGAPRYHRRGEPCHLDIACAGRISGERPMLCESLLSVAVYDDVAECYDASRGGEQRGADFAEQLDTRLPSDEGPILEVGVGTGVISLGLARRGRSVIGVDVASAMLARAHSRLGPVLARGDARRLPFGNGSVPHAVSVWVVHAVDPPEALFAEVFRVLRPGGRYLVCPTNRIPEGDPVKPILDAMFTRACCLHPTWRQNPVTAADIMAWAMQAGFEGRVETFESRAWETSSDELVDSINRRVWPALQGLDEQTFQTVTKPAIDAIRLLPEGPITQHAKVDIAVLSASHQ